MSERSNWLYKIRVITPILGLHHVYDGDAISINSQGELFICDDDDKVIADYPRMGWVDVTITRNYDD